MKTYAILISFVVIGLILTLTATAVPSGHWANLWLVQLAGILVIGGGLGIIDKTLLHSDHFHLTRKLFNVHESTVHLGLTEIIRDSSHYSFASLLHESPTLSIVLNDGRTWISSKISDFKIRFKKPGFTTELFVPDPDGDFISIIARKTGYSREEQVDKITQAKVRLIEEFERYQNNGQLKIYHMSHFPTHSVFIGNENAVITMYGVSSGRRAVPLFVYKKLPYCDCLYCDISDDIDTLRRESLCVYDSTNNQSFEPRHPL